MRYYRRTTSCWLIAQALCFSLLLQGSGIAEAAAHLPPEQTFVTKADLEAARRSTAPDEGRAWSRWIEATRGAAEDTVGSLARWAREARAAAAREEQAPPRVAQAGGVLPLSPRLMAAQLGATSGSQAGPPRPPGQGSGPVEPTPPAEIARLAEKAAALGELPLLAGWNLISLPQEPSDPDPEAVFSSVAGQLARAEVYDVCDTADPWKEYDPADPTGNDLTAVDHRRGIWVKASAAAVLPTGDTPPAATTIELCEGWNLIGFPAGQSRHPHVALSSIAGKWQRVFAYDAFDPEDPWEFFDPTVPDWANDLLLMHPGRGYWVLASEAATLEIRNEGLPPNVALAVPSDLAVVTEPTEIVGTVDSDRLDSWTLTSRPIGDGQPVTLAVGNATVAGGTLATFDPTLLLNGLYELELTATDVQGQQVSESIAVAVEGQMKIGHFTLSFVDLAIPVSGLDIEVVRTYDSRDLQPRDFGVGWSLDVRQGSYRNNRPPGDGWQLQTGFVACDTALESKSHLTVVRLSAQEVYRSALRLVRGVPRAGGGCSATAEFSYVDGPLPGTTLAISGNDQVFQETPSSDRVLDLDTLATYEPRQVRLTTRDGRIFDLDLADGVTRLEDLNGNHLAISPAGIAHSSGRGIVFERDTEGRIVTITDPLSRPTTYSYDAAGDLVAVADRGGNTTRFTYDSDHRVIDIEDPRGIKPIRNEYDAAGRLVRYTDAFGKVFELGHDRANNREIATDRLGHSRVLEYDGRGNVVRETDPLGKVTTRTFDGRDRLLSETDPLGGTVTLAYSTGGDLTALTDPLGNTTSFTSNSRGLPLTITDPTGAVTTNVYGGRDNLTATTNAAGKVTTFSYDARGNLLSTTDAAGNVSSYQYDTFGNLTSVIDALGNETVSTHDGAGNRLTETRTRTLPDSSIETLVTNFTYDSLDRVTTTLAPDGTSSSVAYDLLGKVTSSTDPLGRVTSMTYDLMGRLVRTDHPDGTNETQTYDAEGHVLTQSDRAGRSTTVTYDAAGRLKTTTLADGATTTNSYDAAGRVAATTDAGGNTTTFVYDAAGRRIAVIDPLGNGPTFTYDEIGNQTSVTDARGNTTSFTYDPLNRLTTTTHPDGTTTVMAYDDLGRRIAETDQAGVTTEFAYDGVGRLTSLKDALEQVTSYTYDEFGNHLTQTDTNNHTTSFEYDRLGRQIARIFPDNSRESMSYNVDGTLASHTDFNGATRTFSYDDNQRLIGRAYPDGSSVTFTYTPTGQRASVTDARGTTTYTYDDRDRLLEKTDPTGYGLTYGYDAQGNRTRLTATIGAEVYATTYGYDALNRLASVTDSQGGITTLAYDENGNRAGLAFPNSVATTYTYDGQNRLTELHSATALGEVLNSYRFTLGPAGNRIRIDEHDGTSRLYTYDVLYRLAQDRVTDPAGAQVYQRDFVYDPAGNRLQQAVDEGGGPATIASIYDDRDRLLTVDTTSYGWDANGNLTSKTEGGATSYLWDVENRLTSVTLENGTVVETAYDVDGNRVRTAVTPPAGPATAVDYLVDTTGYLSHVVADVVGGSVQTLYSRADDELIGLYRPASGTQRYYHADGLGSVRALSDESGMVTDRYTYTAFGELLEQSGSDLNPYRFAGEPLDPNSGFYYNRARWLDVASGRFASVDPFREATGEPHSLHRYLYASNEPISTTDPTGLYGEGLVGLGISLAIYGLVGAVVSVAANGLVNKITGRRFFDGWKGAAAFGAAALPLSIAFPIVGLVLAGLGIAGSGAIAWRVWTSPTSFPAQKGGAIFLVGLSLFGAYRATGIAAEGGLWINVAFLKSGLMGHGITAAARRAGEFKQVMKTLPPKQRGKFTMAVGLALDSFGRLRTLIGTSEPRGYIRGPLRHLIQPKDVVVKGGAHAEANIVAHSKANGWTMIAVGATNKVCPPCAAAIAEAGANAATPLR